MRDAVLVVIIIIAGIAGFNFLFNKKSPSLPENFLASTDIKNDEKVQIEILAEGTGTSTKNGDKVTMHFTGMLEDGKIFESSREKGMTFSFVLGKGEVIKGFDMGILGMKVGEKRRIMVPSSLGYGAQGAGNGLIPPDSNLIFEVELLSVNE